MATIDFSNAIIRPNSEYNGKPISVYNIATSITSSTTIITLYRSSPVSAQVSTAYVTVLSYSPTKLSVILTGVITANGVQNETSFCFGASTSSIRAWEISNINYSTGDDYSFQVDFDITVN